MTDYQSNISKTLIIKDLDIQNQVFKCLIKKSLDTQVQKFNNQINQYPKRSLILTLGGRTGLWWHLGISGGRVSGQNSCRPFWDQWARCGRWWRRNERGHTFFCPEQWQETRGKWSGSSRWLCLDFVVDRIKELKKSIGGDNRGDNEWTEMLRGKLHQDTLKDKLAGDRTFKSNQEWVTPTPTDTRDGSSKWSWFGVLFMLNRRNWREQTTQVGGPHVAAPLRTGSVQPRQTQRLWS